jgi:hypothetical protein
MSEPPARFTKMIQAYRLLHEALLLTTSAEEQAVLSELLTTLAQLSRPLADYARPETQKSATNDR